MADVFEGVTIVGAGLTGLSAAHALRKAGIAVQVLEQQAHPGGRTFSLHQDGFVFDTGAITLLPTYTHCYQLIHELGLEQSLQHIQPSIGIVRNGKIHRLDLARPLRSLLSTELLGARGKLSMLGLAADLWRTWKHSNFDSLAPLAGYDCTSVATQLRQSRHPDVLNYIADPIIGGNTLNSCENAPYGELLWMLRQYAAPYLCGLDGGINRLAEALAERLPIHYNTRVSQVQVQAEGVSLSIEQGSKRSELLSRHCLLALPPEPLLQLAPDLSRAQRSFLGSITPLPSLSLHLGLSEAPRALETFILPPSCEDPVLASIVQDHLKAPGRAPRGKGVLTLFCRAEHARANWHLNDKILGRQLLERAERYLGPLQPIIESSHLQRWRYAIIQSECGLYQRMAMFEREPGNTGPVHIAGDFMSMGMEAAVRAGQQAAARLQKQIRPATADAA